MSHVRRSNRKANERRRKAIAESRKPLPFLEQAARAAENVVAHKRRYPNPPRLDPFAHVRGDPELRCAPVPNLLRVPPSPLTFADLCAAFGGRVAKRRPAVAKHAA